MATVLDLQVLDHIIYNVIKMPQKHAADTKLWLQSKGFYTFQRFLDIYGTNRDITSQAEYQVGNVQGQIGIWVVHQLELFCRFII